MTEKLFKRLDYGFGWLAFVIAAIVYLLTLEPTVSFWDCGEFISSSNKLQVGHPPGAPFFMLIARFFAMFASGPEQVALMINAFSGIVSAFTIMFLYWSIAYFAKRMIASDGQYNVGKTIAIIGASMLGAMVYTFSDTFWFSAVEGEVYAFSSFFTAIVFWAILKWSDEKDSAKEPRWLLLISLLVGMSIGVHLLNLLTIPAIAFVFYYKKFKPNVWGFIITTGVSLIIVAMIMWGIIPGVAIIASKLELFFVNNVGMPFNSGLLIWAILCFGFLGASIYFTSHSQNKILNYVIPSVALLLIGAPFMSDSIFINLLLLGGFVYGIVFLANRKKQILNLIMISFTLIMIGYSSYAIIVIRSNANPPMDQNNPDDVFNLLYYLNREQYGDRPLLYGQYFNAEFERYEDTNPIYVKRNNKYEIVSFKQKPVYSDEGSTIFPRMYSPDPEHIAVYKDFGGMKSSQSSPKFSNNIKFFVNYQLNFMYWRYFMWNFAGRQNDIQANGNVIHGNWISGIKSIDNSRLGEQEKLPDYLKANKANNKYYMLPLLLGLIGLGYQLFKNLKDWWIVSLLFILTGLAIVVYLNQTPNQPRERDYAYAGSFYAFAIWIGLSIIGIYDLLKRFSPGIVAGTVATLMCAPVPYIMAKENWDDHDRSDRYIARDFGYNYLMSCAPNAILFTFGDNDTFPIWYAQEVEGIRPDVKVCCLPYFASDWYVDQMKQASYDAAPMPLTLDRSTYEPSVRDVLQYVPRDRGEEIGYISVDSLLNYIAQNDASVVEYNGETYYTYHRNKLYLKVDTAKVLENGTVKASDTALIESIIKFDMKRTYLVKNDMMILDMLRTNNWDRPVYFTSANGSNTPGLEGYLQNEGFSYRLVPINSGSRPRIDKDIMYNNLMKTFKWGNLNNPDILIDHTIARTIRVVNVRNNFKDLALIYAAEGDTVKAKEIISKCDSLLPLTVFTPGMFDVDYANVY
ncbi:MAG: DUF2723 domain-containing protein, partial [Bacteroidales bacterium]|nr:DUF2723 domain-containing protein [Bacteroidales bacterium]